MKWKSRDGRELNIRDMSDSHLKNTIKYIESINYVQIKRMEGGYGEDMWYEEEKIDLKPFWVRMQIELQSRNANKETF